MISKAVEKYLRVSPRKARLTIALIKGKYVDEALNILRALNKKPGYFLMKALNSAIANAKRLPNMRQEDLYISNIFADGGPVLKRYKAQALGRATMIRKRTSHITIELDMKEPKAPVKEAKKVARPKKEKAAVNQPKTTKVVKKSKRSLAPGGARD